MEENFANLNIDDDEEVPVRFAEEDEDVIDGYRHGEDFCPVRLTMEEQDVELRWDSSLRVQSRKVMQMTRPWLREEPREGAKVEGRTNSEQHRGNQSTESPGENRGSKTGNHGTTGKKNVQSRAKFFNSLVNERVSIKGKEVVQE
ncbi:hypothetical protein Goari_022009 [Gossypium aridum]|uniref:Uncharacterized protein n=1 Tax=Gossypium aridum TaxID=34290 RepID=A0A7J8YP56_GOSAI|nr:hypothetical protein [Gossypium aridum]